jgi:Mn-dependent DtxR family transcriptional regulator
MNLTHDGDRAEVWKEFEQNPISHSAAHHLMAIDDLVQRLGYARVSDVARQLRITRGSVSITLQSLKKDGLIVQDENRHLRLSEHGQKLVDQIKAKRHLIKRLFADVLGLDPAQAEIDACKIEHLISGAAARHLLAFLKFVDTDSADVKRFVAALRKYNPMCRGHVDACAVCADTCLTDAMSE